MYLTKTVGREINVPKEQYFGDGIPDRLQRTSVEGMLIEKLYIPDTVMDDSELSDLGDEVDLDDDAIYVDKTQAGGLGRLAIDKRCAVKVLDKIDPADFNSVILMKAYVQDGANLCCGVIADCRFYKGSFGVDSGKEIDFTDQEEMWETLDDQANKLVISAVIDVEDGQIKIWGDSAFFDAAVYMTKLVSDKYSKCEESDEQTSKSDTVLRKSELQDKAKKAISSFSKTCEYAVGGLNKWIRDHRK